ASAASPSLLATVFMRFISVGGWSAGPLGSRLVIGFCPRLLFMLVRVSPSRRKGRTRGSVECRVASDALCPVSPFGSPCFALACPSPLATWHSTQSPAAYSVEKNR